MRTIEMTSELGFYIRRAQQLNSLLWTQYVSPEITSLQFAALNCLRQQSDVDQRTLGRIIGMDRSTTAELVTRMTKRGLIKVDRDDSDFRRRVLELTSLGEETLDEMLTLVVKLSKILAKPLETDEHVELRTLLKKLVDGLDGVTAPAETRKPRATARRRQSKPRSR